MCRFPQTLFLRTYFSLPAMKASISPRANAALLDAKYEEWRIDPQNMEPTWSAFFEGFELGVDQSSSEDGESLDGVTQLSEEQIALRAKIVSLVYSYRSLGHTVADIDPLGKQERRNEALELAALGFKEADLDREFATSFFQGNRKMTLRIMIGELRKIYCGKIGFEFLHIHNQEIRNWLRERIERRFNEDRRPKAFIRKKLFKWLEEAEALEHFLGKKFVGVKRFSLEGSEGMMVGLNTVLNHGPELGVEEIVMGMAHRGRVNVLANFLRKPLPLLFHEFHSSYVPDLLTGDGDVKYHLGYEVTRQNWDGQEVKVFLAANPSHLEAVNPVVQGKARARQRIIGDSVERKRVLPILVHGDAAFAGQGPVAEVLNLSQLTGYRTGGTIHLVVNNQIGFTTMPEDARSSAYCTDVAKMIDAPILHVNGDEPEEIYWAFKLALRYRQDFGRDIVIDLLCYRRQGHNEADQAAFTQPQQARTIAEQLSVTQKYKKHLLEEDPEVTEPEVQEIIDANANRLEKGLTEVKALLERGEPPADPTKVAILQNQYNYQPCPTGIETEKLLELGHRLVSVPEGFRINPTLEKRFLPRRREALEQGGPYDWAFAEALAFASLLVEGIGVRLSGQDSRRGTFSQRHSVFYDTETRERHIPLLTLSEDQAKFCVYNSLLSENAVLGFDYGYSLMVPQVLILWEAQFGDFANGAQVIIDQFIASSESKWQQPSGIVMLLPHGYEGMGPEHSSARLERFLQLCAEGNMQVCNLTKPAQYFHLLRRQMKRENFRKPLIVMSPKSLLSHPGCTSRTEDFAGESRFQEILRDERFFEHPERVSRLIFCSGKVYFDLVKYREEQELNDVALIRVEQLYPFHWELIKEIISPYAQASKWVWCQEEPLNQGAWFYISHRLQKLTRHRIRFAGRDRAASPAVGSKALHEAEQRKLVEQAFHV
ncbi:MAG: 2-oxoglutarate dehydrogenase E1 component [Verrucomicrobiota bacterium]